MNRVIHINSLHTTNNVVRIDRGTRWGNPFVVGVDGTRSMVIESFRQYAIWRLTVQPKWLDGLKGKDLACWCAPKECHGDVILELLKGIK